MQLVSISQKSSESSSERVLGVLLLIAVATMWLRHLCSSFWLDETLSLWVASGSFSQAIERSLNFQGQSPLYFVLLHWWINLVGSSEWLVRVPSVLCLVASLSLFYRLALFFGDRRFGLSSALLFVASQSAVFAATNARPYALATLFAIASFVLWIEAQRCECWNRPLFIGSLVAAVAAFYTHYMYWPLVLFHLVLPKERGLVKRRLWFVLAYILAILPAVPFLLELKERSALLGLGGTPSWIELVLSLLQPGILLLVFLSLALHDGVLRRGLRTEKRPIPLKECALLFILPTVALFCLSYLLQTQTLFKEHYLFWRLPFLLLIFSFLLRKRSVLATYLLVFFLFAAEPYRATPNENWRALVGSLSSEVDVNGSSAPKVLLYSGLLESQNVELLETSEPYREYLSAPLRAYGYEGDVVPLPLNPLDQSAEPYLKDIARNISTPDSRVTVAGSNGILVAGVKANQFVEMALRQVGLFKLKEETFEGSWLQEYGAGRTLGENERDP
ncbi:MAG: glycosyltransferase family 39 protein [Bdellovibrionales bacterium]|nr:glycosyltransferase family 39 protein [Bdellovibrionales bacterium]